jgi:hypothetical protein
MAWPFDKKPEDVQVGDGKPEVESKPPEKTPSELIAEALTPLTQKLTELGDRFAALEQNVVRRPVVEEQQAERPTVVSVLDDENAAFNQRLGPILLAQYDVAARLARSDVKNEYLKAGYGELWDQYEPEINKVLDATPLATAEGKPFRGDPQYIRNTVDMIFGREARKAGMRFDGKSRSFFLESSSGGDGSTATPINDGLTEGQRRLLSHMKVSVEDAKKAMAKLKFVS